MKKCLFSILVLSCCLATAIPAAELETIQNATLIEAGLNDGDSFKVKAAGKELHLRLYYVDCLETTFGTDAELERISEQQNYFGLQDTKAVMRLGKKAALYVKRVLSRPFTVHTSYAFAPGRSATGRYYAFIETHDGRDLGHLLVEQGLARIHGKKRSDPNDTPRETVLEELQDMRSVAMLNRAGAWAETDPSLLPDMHKRQREKDQEWEKFREKLKPSCDDPMDLNTTSKEQLQEIPRVGPATAEKIVKGRPYRSVEDLLNIPGIGPKTLAKMRPCVTIGK